MVLGDDDRRQKSQPHREAAFSRWENRGERAARRTGEAATDALDWLLRIILMLLMVPVRVLGAVGRALMRMGPGERRQR